MLKMLRKNVLVDLGPPANVLGADKIKIPDKYKRIDSRGTILSIGPQCQLLEQSAVGEECFIGINQNSEGRFNPRASEALGLKPHWHFIVPEKLVQVTLEE